MDDHALREATRALEAAGQSHLVEHARTLSPETARPFLLDAAARPWEVLRAAARPSAAAGFPELRPPQALTLRRIVGQPALRDRLAGLGRGLLQGGRVAVLLLAGGQGTRLGFEGPKGTLVFGPQPDRSLYRIHAERVAAASREAGRPVPVYILVSSKTDAATRAAFEDADFFGLESGQVEFLAQSDLPCLDDEGRALIAAQGELAVAPDGHGGAFSALCRAGVPETLVDRGIDVLATYQVDNPLGRPLDPVMLGWMVERRLQAVGKAVRKSEPGEKVGVFARDLQGRQRIIEYSELPESEVTGDADAGTREATLDLGSIAIHGFATSWLKDLAERGFELPLHRARKKVPHLDSAGRLVEPEEPNGIKLERFIFDLFPEASRAEVQEVDRSREFAPVKYAEGVDSLLSARELVAAEVRRWHRESGLPEPTEPALMPLEIDGPA